MKNEDYIFGLISYLRLNNVHDQDQLVVHLENYFNTRLKNNNGVNIDKLKSYFHNMDERKRNNLDDLKKAYGLPDISSWNKNEIDDSEESEKNVESHSQDMSNEVRSINDQYSSSESQSKRSEAVISYQQPKTPTSHNKNYQTNSKYMFKEIIWPLLMFLGLIFLLIFGYKQIKTFVGNSSAVETVEIGDKLNHHSVVDDSNEKKLDQASDEQIDQVMETILNDENSPEEKAEEVAEILDKGTSDRNEDGIDYSDATSSDSKSESLDSKPSQAISNPGAKSSDTSTECLVVVGLFGESANANKMIKKIRGAGFDASMIPYQGKNLVGVPVSCSGYQNTLSKVQAQLEKGAWLKRL